MIMNLNKVTVSTKYKINDVNWLYKECEIIDPNITPTINSDEFGGNKDIKKMSTGYFRTEQINNRWNIINPNGNQYIFSGINTVTLKVESNNRDSFFKKYASTVTPDLSTSPASQAKYEEAWANDTITFLRDKKIYGLGAWSNYQMINKSNIQKKKMNYTIILYLLQKYAVSVKKAQEGNGHFNYQGDVIPIFDNQFKNFVDQEMSNYAKYANDPYLIGYFTDNELPFYSKSLDNFLKLNINDQNRIAAENWLKNQHIKTLNDLNRNNFLKFLVGTYCKIVSEAIKKYDKNHLILGPRLHGNIMKDVNVWLGLNNYVDVVSINFYSDWYVTDDIINLAKKINKPFIVSEFYTKSIDSGLGNTSGAGWIVKNQMARGYFYQNFAIKLLKCKLCVGWNWLQYMDNNSLSSNDPSNIDSNKGIVDIQFSPYTDLLNQMRLLNRNIYDLIKHFDAQH